VIDTTAFCYVDTAVGGSNHRNRVMRLDELCPPANAVDVFATYFRYDEGLVEHWKTHRNDLGNPTVKGYRGPCWSPVLPYDLDAPDPADALADVCRLLRYVGDTFNVPPDAVRLNYSGSKGFHAELPGVLFGHFEPGPNLPDRFAELAGYLARQAGLTTHDPTLYEHLRLYRLPNTIHGKTQRYAVPLDPRAVLGC
jgi:hypothetical protein